MPKLVRLYIVSVLIGIVLAMIFTALLIVLDVARLRHLIASSDMGWLAVFMLVFFNSIIFASVQFAIAVMSLADGSGGGGRRFWQWVAQPQPAPIPQPVRADHSPQ
ncbi:hypothetical protein [Paracoccus sp. (in: a-proteobacteria)]|uniref:hypothetical protein n=1 Tax=Paracoccus sp. TaxID=267 RepID=UPI0026DFD521|nr:hypothetical protein [Paracoccus sp. (in: a-proteobacteria)]MDO5646450.1 hypothetical protein [Paracoccus sp. (in: a-proteobacteria)]